MANKLIDDLEGALSRATIGTLSDVRQITQRIANEYRGIDDQILLGKISKACQSINNIAAAAERDAAADFARHDISAVRQHIHL